MLDQEYVFVIEDDPDLRRAIDWLLKSVGYKSRSYASAGEFFGAFKPEMGGCVITDLRLPGMSGIDLMHKLRALGATTPVIVITAHGSVPTSVLAMKLGALDFLEKSFDDQVLLDLVNKGMAEGRLRKAEADSRRSLVTALGILSARETAVLHAAVYGLSCKETAEKLHVSHKTVHTYRTRLLQKTNFPTIAELRIAIERLSIQPTA